MKPYKSSSSPRKDASSLLKGLATDSTGIGSTGWAIISWGKVCTNKSTQKKWKHNNAQQNKPQRSFSGLAMNFLSWSLTWNLMNMSGFFELTTGVGSTFEELAAEDGGASFIREVDVSTGAAAINGIAGKALSTCLRSNELSSMVDSKSTTSTLLPMALNGTGSAPKREVTGQQNPTLKE